MSDSFSKKDCGINPRPTCLLPHACSTYIITSISAMSCTGDLDQMQFITKGLLGHPGASAASFGLGISYWRNQEDSGSLICLSQIL